MEKSKQQVEVTTPEVLPVQVAQPTPVAEAVVVQKSGGGKKWLACCLIVLILCCCCTVVLGYLAVFQTGNFARALMSSNKDTSLTHFTSAEVKTFDWNKYVATNPAKDLGNNRFEITIPEDVFIKLLFFSSESNYLADYTGVKIKKDLLKMQIDIGSVIAIESQKANSPYNNTSFNTTDLKGIYANVELSTTADHKSLVIKSVRLGDSALDLNTLNPSLVQQIQNEITSSPEYKQIEEIEFKDGSVRVVVKDINLIGNTGV